MSTQTDWLDVSPAETEQTVQHLEQEMGTPKEFQIAQLVQVIQGQLDQAMLKPNGWLEVACIDCEHVETFFGPVSQFAVELNKLGWAADSVERATASCRSCSNADPNLTDREIWEDQAVYAARKGEQG